MAVPGARRVCGGLAVLALAVASTSGCASVGATTTRDGVPLVDGMDFILRCDLPAGVGTVRVVNDNDVVVAGSLTVTAYTDEPDGRTEEVDGDVITYDLRPGNEQTFAFEFARDDIVGDCVLEDVSATTG